MKICTIGFAQKSAEQFFTTLRDAGVDLLVDIRLHPDGQLAGFARKVNLPYFLRELSGCGYVHLLELAPSEQIFNEIKKSGDRKTYNERFRRLMELRDIPNSLDRSIFEDHVTCLMCTEPKPKECHRSLVAQRLAEAWRDVEVVHL